MYEDVILSRYFIQLNVEGDGDMKILERCFGRNVAPQKESVSKFHHMAGGVRLRPRPGASTDTGTATRV